MGRGKRWFANFGTGAIVLGLFVVFVLAVAWFRRPQPTAEDRIDSIAEVLKPDPISQAVLNGAIDTEARVVNMALVEDGRSVGEGRRGEKNDQPFFEFEMSLPEINREAFFYQVWLVRPIPYDFFALGEMITNDEGIFVLEWEGEEEKDFSAYVDVVVTRQEYGGSTDPLVHIAEGTFGK